MCSAIQAQTVAPIWELGKGAIDPELTMGKVEVVNGTVALDGANAFSLPANVLGAQNDYTIEFEVKRPADAKQGHGLTFVSNTDESGKAGLGLKYFPPEYNAIWLFCNGYQTVEQRGFLNGAFNKVTCVVKDKRLSLFRNGLILAVTDEIKPSACPLTFGEIRTARIAPYELRNIRVYDQAIFPTGFDRSAERMRHVSGDQYTMQRADIKNPSLPRILVVGDSISMGYRGYIAEHFKDRAYVDYWVGSGCSWYGKSLGDKDSTAARAWKGVLSNGPYDVVSWNAMTLHWWSPSQSNRCPESALAMCATEAVEHLKKTVFKTQFIWVRCTPIRSNLADGTPTLDNPDNARMVTFNAIVDEVMKRHGIPEVDLYSSAVKQLHTVKKGSQDTVHWGAEVSRLFADAIIMEIEKHLPASRGCVPLAPALPKPTFEGTPIDVRSPHREAYRGEGVPPPPLLVPRGVRLISSRRPVTCNDSRAKPSDLALVTDGDKQYSASAYLELAPGVRWIQLDLGTNAEIYAVCLWRERPEQCVYRDTVVQVSNDPTFVKEVTTLFNNDYDDSTGLGKGADKEYFEDYFGRRVAGHGARARHVRITSNGNTSNPYSHFTEVEVYGR